VPRQQDPTLATRPLLDLAAGYVQRAVHQWPRQGSRAPWTLAMSYAHDVRSLRKAPVADPALRFSARPRGRAPQPASRALAASA